MRVFATLGHIQSTLINSHVTPVLVVRNMRVEKILTQTLACQRSSTVILGSQKLSGQDDAQENEYHIPYCFTAQDNNSRIQA